MEAREIPGQAELVAMFKTPGAPPRLTLDIGGSADLNGNGIVEASLDAEGNLVIKDV